MIISLISLSEPICIRYTCSVTFRKNWEEIEYHLQYYSYRHFNIWFSTLFIRLLRAKFVSLRKPGNSSVNYTLTKHFLIHQVFFCNPICNRSRGFLWLLIEWSSLSYMMAIKMRGFHWKDFRKLPRVSASFFLPNFIINYIKTRGLV